MASPKSKAKLRIVPASELDPKKGLRAVDYIRQITVPELTTISMAKSWRRSMLRHAQNCGYGQHVPADSGRTLKDWFRSNGKLGADWRLFQTVEALVQHEKKNRSR